MYIFLPSHISLQVKVITLACLIGIPIFLLWVSPQSINSILLVATAQLFYVSFLTFKHILDEKYRSNPFIVGAFLLFIYIGVSPIIIYSKVDVVSISWLQFLTEEGIDNKSILKSQLLLNIFGLSLLTIGIFLVPLICKFRVNLSKDIDKKSKLLSFFGCFLLITQLSFLFTGSFSLGGISVNEVEDGINPILAILMPFYFTIPYIGGQLIKKKSVKLIWLIILSIQFPWLLLMNKRSMLLGIYFFLVSYFNFDIKKISFRTFTIVGLLLFLFAVGSSSFQRLRYIDADVFFNNLDLSSIPVLIEVVRNFDDQDLQANNDLYLSMRFTGSVLPLARFCYLLDNQKVFLLKGEDIINNLKSSTPSDFLFDKSSIPINEILYSLRYGSLFDYNDTGNTIILQGLIDFGYQGVFFYIIIYLLLIILSYLFFIKDTNNLFVKLVFFCQISGILINCYEQTFIDLFASLRIISTTFMIIIFYIFCRKFITSNL